MPKAKKVAPKKAAATKTKKPSRAKNKGVEPQDELKAILPKKGKKLNELNNEEVAAAFADNSPSPIHSDEVEFKNISLRDIKVSPSNPRTTFDEKKTLELADSVSTHGVLQSILVRPFGKPGKYQLVCGERRYRASEIAGRTTIPATVRELTDDQALEIQIIENLQREAVSPIEEAIAYQNLMKLKGFDVAEVAHRVGKSPTFIAQRLKLNELIEDFKKLLFEERITLTDALKVCKLKVEDQTDLYENECTGYNVEHRLIIDDDMLRLYMYDLTDAPFDTKSLELNKELGACTHCQFNTASNTLLFPEGEHEARCTNRECFKGKTETSFGIELDKAHGDPAIVLVSTFYRDAIIKQYAAKGMKVYDAYGYSQVDGKSRGAKVAYVVNGNKKGTYIFVKLKATNNEKAEQTSEDSSSIDRRAELTEQIATLKQREERKEELDFVKVMPALYKELEDNKPYGTNTNELFRCEKAALILALEKKSCWWQNNDDDFWESIGVPDESSIDDGNIYEWLKGQTDHDLDMFILYLNKDILLNELTPNTDDCPQKSGLMMGLLDIVDTYLPEMHKSTIEAIEVDRTKRKAKLTPRIAALEKELADLPAEDPKTKKK